MDEMKFDLKQFLDIALEESQNPKGGHRTEIYPRNGSTRPYGLSHENCCASVASHDDAGGKK
jgi:hypothetical protein